MSELEQALGVGAACGEATTLHGDGAVVAERYAHMQIVAAALARDKAQLSSYVERIMLQHPTPGYERVDDEHRVAVSWGRLAHDHAPEVMCGEDDDCQIVPSDEEHATLALIRVEVAVQRCTVAPSPDGWCPACSTSAGPVRHA